MLPMTLLRSATSLLALTLTFLAGCETKTDDSDLRWISPSEALSLGQNKGFSIGREKTVVYVDPRNEKAYAAGHIPGAILVPFEELRSGAAEPLEQYDLLVVYDTDYDDVVARAFSKRLIEIDLWDVYTLTGGLKSWEKAGNEVAYGLPNREVDAEGKAVEAVAKPRYGQKSLR